MITQLQIAILGKNLQFQTYAVVWSPLKQYDVGVTALKRDNNRRYTHKIAQNIVVALVKFVIGVCSTYLHTWGGVGEDGITSTAAEQYTYVWHVSRSTFVLCTWPLGLTWFSPV